MITNNIKPMNFRNDQIISQSIHEDQVQKQHTRTLINTSNVVNNPRKDTTLQDAQNAMHSN